jgi:enoyl-[acyl-carrier protein] reductase I
MHRKELPLKNKRALVVGVANNRSLAWAIAPELSAQGAKIALSYQNERSAHRLNPLIELIDPVFVQPCDVADEEQLDRLFEAVETHWESFDILVHSVAFANANAMSSRLTDISRENFLAAMDVSAYSLIALTQRAEPFLRKVKGSIITLSYYGAQKVIPGYGVMGVAKSALESQVRYLAEELGCSGIRINALSAGPVKTLSAAAISAFDDKLQIAKQRAPMRDNITAEDVAAFACFLASPLSRHITGGTHYVDAGLNILGA